MAWYDFLDRVFNRNYKGVNKNYREMKEKDKHASLKRTEEEKYPYTDPVKTYFEGMRSNRFYINQSLEEYIEELNQKSGWSNDPDERMGKYWRMVGDHLGNAMHEISEKMNLPKPSFPKKKIEY